MDRAQELIDRGYAARHKGDLPSALEFYQAAAETIRPLHEPLRLAHTVRHGADIQRRLQLFEESRGNYAEALALYRGDTSTGKLDLANTLRGYALLSEEIGDIPSACAMWTEARELYAAVDVQPGVDEADRWLAILT